jgi:type II secretory pathway pseudopilin PulG
MQTRTKHELIVIAIVAALVLAVLIFFGIGQAKIGRFVFNVRIISEIASATEEYRKAYGEPLDTLDNHQLVKILCRAENPEKKLFLPSSPYSSIFDLMLNPSHDAFIDIWGHELRFLRGTEGKITVLSAGPNGIFEDSPGSDDIRSQ